VPSERDPLSARYDRAAQAAVTKAIRAGGGWVRVPVPRPGDKAIEWAARYLGVNILGGGDGSWAGKHGELAWMTAFRRACYWDDRIYLWARPAAYDGDERSARTRIRNPARSHALKLEWEPRRVRALVLRGRHVRVARLRVFSIRSASAYAARERPHHD
jgi:hypothetical protein